VRYKLDTVLDIKKDCPFRMDLLTVENDDDINLLNRCLLNSDRECNGIEKRPATCPLQPVVDLVD
jgi:hypothetical protein